MIEVLIFLAGLVISALGAVRFSAAAVHLAALLKLPRILIGASVVSMATTTPETIVAILASLKNHSGLALGNALGSPVANLSLILGLVLFFGRVRFEKNVFRASLILVVLALFSYLLILWQRTIDFVGGILLIFAGILYLIFLLKTAEDEKGSQESLGLELLAKFVKIAISIFWLTVGLALIIFGGFLLISGAVNLGKILGVSEIFIGLTLVAVGTSLPELSLALVSILRKSVSVSVGNLIGASVLTLTLTLGVAAVISPVKTTPSVFIVDFPAILAIMAVFLLAQILKISHKFLGASFLVFYLFYIITLKIVG